jgi:hypothetical protein
MKYRTKKRNRLSGSQKRKRNSIRGAEWHAEIVAREEAQAKQERQEAWQEGWSKGRDFARRMEEAEGRAT